MLAPKRYKAAYGGRGGAKSHFFAEQVVVRCCTRETRAVCIREVQKSLRESVRQLIIDKIAKLGVGGLFDVLDAEIRGRNGSLIIFVGMQSYNAENIKSLENFDIAWVEEAQSLSEKSLRLLRPTIRKEESEIWFSWNPRFEDDAVDNFCRGPNAPGSDMMAAVSVGWRDNPWFPEILRKEMEADLANDPEMAEHIWDGGYQIISEGSYYGKMLVLAMRDGRIGDVPYDPRALVTTGWDLGFGDDTAIWFAQFIGDEPHIIDYYENRGLALDRYAKVVREKPYVYHQHILPHDGAKGELIAGSTIVATLKNLLGANIEVLPRLTVAEGINAARMLIPRCWFDAGRCAPGLKALRNYRRQYIEDRKTFSDIPLHDWTSDAADAFRYLAMGLRPHEDKMKPIAYPKRTGIV
ncbi:MAG: PBSX family phage terminase large subunit [Xanthobacteraceae bacterium]|nr:PBSX family phage terminase large subunit [Xanthobacteraceae bacterium]